jgi:Contractile injection system tube protein
MKHLRLLLFISAFLPVLLTAQNEKLSEKACLDLKYGKILLGTDCKKAAGPIVWGSFEKGTFSPSNTVEFLERATPADPAYTPGWIELRTGKIHYDYEGRAPQGPYLRGGIDSKGLFYVFPQELMKWGGSKEYRKPDPPPAGKGGSQQASLQSVEGAPIDVRFTPTEITIERAITWNRSGPDTVSFQTGRPRTLQVEIQFDAGTGVYESYVRQLENLAEVDSDMRRPPKCQFIWGPNFPRFTGVVENLSVQYTQFLSDGTPVRATVNLRMLEAVRVSM